MSSLLNNIQTDLFLNIYLVPIINEIGRRKLKNCIPIDMKSIERKTKIHYFNY